MYWIGKKLCYSKPCGVSKNNNNKKRAGIFNEWAFIIYFEADREIVAQKMTVVSIAMDMQLRKSVKPAVAALNNVINPDFIECTFVLPHCRTTGELISQLSVVCTVKIACSGFFRTLLWTVGVHLVILSLHLYCCL